MTEGATEGAEGFPHNEFQLAALCIGRCLGINLSSAFDRERCFLCAKNTKQEFRQITVVFRSLREETGDTGIRLPGTDRHVAEGSVLVTS